MKTYLTSKIKKKTHGFLFFFCNFMSPDLGKKTFTTWNVLKSEVYLTCINFWKFHDDLKACLEVVRLDQVDLKMWNLVSTCNFSHFWPPEKIRINDKFKTYFFIKWTWKCSHPTKPIFLFKFLNFKGSPENAPNHILSSNSAGKIFKTAIKSESLGLCSWNFWNFLFSMRLSHGEYFKDFKYFDLTWIWSIWLEWPTSIMVTWPTNRPVLSFKFFRIC